MSLSYRILIRRDQEGGYTVTVPALPGCITGGDTLEDAIENAREAVELYIESLLEMGEDVPTEDETLELILTVATPGEATLEALGRRAR